MCYKLIVVTRVCRKQHGFVGGRLEASVDRLKKDPRESADFWWSEKQCNEVPSICWGWGKECWFGKNRKENIFRLLYFHWSTLTYQHSRVACEWSCVRQVPGKFQDGRQKACGGRGDTTGLYRKATWTAGSSSHSELFNLREGQKWQQPSSMTTATAQTIARLF